MKKGLLILGVFLLTPFIGICQTGTTLYPFTGEQVRTMAHVKLAYENVLEQNRTLLEMVDWCDSISELNHIAISEKDLQLKLKDRQIQDQVLIIGLQDDKFKVAEKQINKQSTLKHLFIGTTILAAIVLTVSLVK